MTTYTHARTHTHTHTYTYAHIHTYTYVCGCVYKYILTPRARSSPDHELVEALVPQKPCGTYQSYLNPNPKPKARNPVRHIRNLPKPKPKTLNPAAHTKFTQSITGPSTNNVTQQITGPRTNITQLNATPRANPRQGVSGTGFRV